MEHTGKNIRYHRMVYGDKDTLHYVGLRHFSKISGGQTPLDFGDGTSART